MDPFSDKAADADREHQLAQHLSRAGELLRGEELDAAEREVSAALGLAPNDLRARNLLGLLRFRAGRNEEAHALYRELVAQHPEDVSLHLNLGLVELRLARNAEAAEHLRRVVEKEPQNTKAQGYYGMALMRSGDLARAREAFVAAGQDDLVRQVTEKLGDKGAPRGALPTAPGAPRVDGVAPAPGALERLALDSIGRATDGDAPGKSRVESPRPVAAFLDSRRLAPGPQPFALVDGELLVVRVDGRLPTRTSGALASSGRLAYAPMLRRVRGRDSQEPFGDGPDAMCVASGSGLIVVSPRGGRFHLIALAGDVVYLRESAVYAFEDTLHFENGRIPGGGPGAMPVLALRGDGSAVVRTRRAPYALTVSATDVFYVDQDGLLGWTGQVVPQQMRDAEGQPTPFITCTGEGTVLLEEPPPNP